MIKDYVAFDLETTGLDVLNEEIIEIGALKVRDGKVIERFIEFIKPTKPISTFITNITGITNEMVENVRDTEAIIRDFVSFCAEDVLVGHNILFDYKFMKKYTMDYGLSFDKRGIDTLHIARKTHKQLESKRLETLCDYYHIENKAAHRAYHDALATAKLYHHLSHDFEKKYPTLFDPEILQYRPKKVQPCTKKQMEYLEVLCEYHNLTIPQDIKEYTRSKASQLIDHIIATHGKMF